MKVTINNLGHEAFLQNYTITKKSDDIAQISEIDTEAIFDGDGFRELLTYTNEGAGKEPVLLETYCGDDIISYNGYIRHNEGKYNILACKASKNVFFDHPLECIKDRTFNIFDYTPTTTETVLGNVIRETYENVINWYFFDNIEYTLDDVLNLLGGIPDRSSDNFIIEFANIQSRADGDGMSEFYNGHQLGIFVTYVKVVSPVKHTNEWIPAVGGGFYFSGLAQGEWSVPNYYLTSILINQFGERTDALNLEQVFGKALQFRDIEISNTFEVNEILLDLISCTGFPLISNFFGINPDGSNPNNGTYENALQYYQQLRICQSYDIIRESAIQDSFGQSGAIKFKDFAENINKMFNTTFVFDQTIGAIRLEHVSYFHSKGFNLQAQNKPYELSDEFELNKDLIKKVRATTFSLLTPFSLLLPFVCVAGYAPCFLKLRVNLELISKKLA